MTLGLLAYGPNKVSSSSMSGESYATRNTYVTTLIYSLTTALSYLFIIAFAKYDRGHPK